MKYSYLIYLLLLTTLSCQAQEANPSNNQIIGGPCEGCEAVLEYGNQTLSSTDTLPGFLENEPKLKVTGIVYEQDGSTPASDIILYVYHTNREGIYPARAGDSGWARRHGYIRQWVKTDQQGRYTFYTFRPAAYPGRTVPEHIHITVKEPNKNEYYIDDYFFDDDPLLTPLERNRRTNRGGSGIVKPILDGEIYQIERDIILGLNIPNYY